MGKKNAALPQVHHSVVPTHRRNTHLLLAKGGIKFFYLLPDFKKFSIINETQKQEVR
jgi:hypothetical protein